MQHGATLRDTELAYKTYGELNVVFLEGVKSALTVDAVFKDGWCTEKPAKGLRQPPACTPDRRDPNNLLTMVWTWQNGNIGATPGRGFEGDRVAALRTIKTKMIVLPALKDLYFPPEDEKFAVSHIQNAELRVIPGVYGTLRVVARTPKTSSSTTTSKSSSRADARTRHLSAAVNSLCAKGVRPQAGLRSRHDASAEQLSELPAAKR